MLIKTNCTECEEPYWVQDDNLGKRMPCRICGEKFVVRSTEASKMTPVEDREKAPPPTRTGESRIDAPAPKYQSGSVADFLQVLSTEAEAEPIAEMPSADPAPARIPVGIVDEESFPDFEVVEDVSPPKSVAAMPTNMPAAGKKRQSQKENDREADDEPMLLEAAPEPTQIKWSPDLAPPPSRRGSVVVETEPEPEMDDEPAEAADEEADRDEKTDDEPPSHYRDEEREGARPRRIRRRKKKSRFVLMLFLLAIIVGGLGLGGYWLKRHMDGQPERDFANAKKEYDQKNYDQARKLFEELAKEHPKDPRAAEARFFVELCSLRTAVHSVTVRADPTAAQAQLDKFLKAMEQPGMQTYLEPKRYDIDAWQCTLKLTEDLKDKAGDEFKLESPDESETWLKQAEAVGGVVDRFRPKDTVRENVYEQMATLRKQIDGSRTRTRLLAAAKERLAEADDRIIDEVRTDAQMQVFFAGKEPKDARLFDDAAFKQLLVDAETRIQQRVAYKRYEKPIEPKPARGNNGAGLLFAPRVDVPDPNRIPPPVGESSVFFASARGVICALDDVDGRVLWATRVGIDGDSLPLHLAANELHKELVLVVSNDGAQAGLTARFARTGEARWHQALPAPVVGRPILVGRRVFVQLGEAEPVDEDKGKRPDLGVVWEIEIANGNVLGRIVLGRPHGGSAARRPGTGQLFFPAEAKGVYVFDVEKLGADGARLDPLYLGIVNTGHSTGTLRGDPVITAGEGETPSYLILSITDGLEAMKLRAFPLSPADQPPAIQGELPPPIALNGWSWFPPYCDAEKLAVVTDRGEFGLFGIKQAGNLDVPLFVLPPSPYLVGDIHIPARGQIVYADEHDFWFLARGLLYHLKIGFDAERGLRLVQRGTPFQIGEPLQPAQVSARGDVALVVTQASASSSCRATAIDLRNGRIRWQRQLGLVSQGDPIRIGDAVVLMDQDGGLYKIDGAPIARAGDGSWLIEDRWLVARPLNDVVEASQFLASRDGSSAFAMLSTRTPQGSRIVVRRFTPGQPLEEHSEALPAPVAGNAIVLGKQVVVPLANGMLYRMNLATDRPLEAGPTWRGEKISAQAVCHLAALNDDEFVATDGGRALNRWRWIGGQDDFSKRGSLTLSDRIAAPPVVVLEGESPRLFLIDIRNNATLWDAERLTANPTPLRAWRSGEKGVLPGGAATNGPSLVRDANGKPRIVFIVDKLTVVMLAPDAAKPLWIVDPKEREPGDMVIGKPTVFGNRLYLTHRAGRCVSLDLDKGEALDELGRLRGSAVPAGAAVALQGLLLAPLSDGTVFVRVSAPPPKAPAKPPLCFFPLPPLGIPIPLPARFSTTIEME